MSFEYIKIEKDGKLVNSGVPLKKDGIYFFDGEENYWLFSSGKSKDLYNSFFEDELIGIGWDKITLNEIKNNSEDELKELIEERYDFLRKNYDTEKGFRQYISLTANKLRRFVFDIKLGDIIVLKDRGKNRIMFGKVVSNSESSDNENLRIDAALGFCNKIRKVSWIKSVEKDSVSSDLRLAMTARHALSALEDEKVKEEINREMFSFFYRGKNLHMVFRVGKEENIEFDKFNELQRIIENEKNKCLEKTKTENRLSIKTNVQSPGPIEYFGNPVIINHIYTALIASGTMVVGYLGLKRYLKLKEPGREIKSGFSEGN